MVFGDNVRARRAARALPRTPTQRKRKKEKRTEKTSNETTHPSHRRHSTIHNTTRQDTHYHHHMGSAQTIDTPSPFYPLKPSPLFNNDTTLSQRHTPKPTMV